MEVEPLTIRTLHIFLASPGDMEEERKAVRAFFNNYNLRSARHRGLRFEVLDWENYASLGVGDPQTLISRDTLLHFRSSLALVIGLMGQRFGTPTERAGSGTEEEFDTAIALRQELVDFPEIKWFFRTQWGKAGAPTDPAGMAQALEQMQKVAAFKQRLQSGETKLLYGEFDTTDEFPTKLAADLEPWLNDTRRPWNKAPPPTSSAPDTRPRLHPDAEVWLASYLKLLRDECDELPLDRLGTQEARVRLPAVHVPLDAVTPPERPDADDPAALDRHARRLDRGEGEDRTPILDLLAADRIAVVVGGAGSGKSVLVNHLAARLIEPDAEQPFPAAFRGLTPVRLTLRRVQAPATRDAGADDWLWRALGADVNDKLKTLDAGEDAAHRAAAVVDLIKGRLDATAGLLFLLDGLDEVTAAGEQRAHLVAAIDAFASALPEQHCLLVTARPYAYARTEWQLRHARAFTLAPLDEEQRAVFFRRWHRVGRGVKHWTEADAEQRAADLIATVEGQPQLKDLAERPLHATLIALLNLRGRLPHDRAALYKEAVDLLLARWRSGESAFRAGDGRPVELPEEELLASLQTLAYQTHRNQRAEGETEAAADIERDAVLDAFDDLIERRVPRRDLLAYLNQHTGILVARAEDRFAFPHRAFQEYLAMGWLVAREDDALARTVRDDPVWWREVFRLAVGSQRASRRLGVGYVRELLEGLDEQPADTRHHVAVLAGLALLELDLDWRATGFDEVRKAVRARLVNLIEDPEALDPPERAEAGEVLGHLGDPRPGVGTFSDPDTGLDLPNFAWIQIPGGDFLYGEEKVRHQVEGFAIARYPVTHSQFQCFLDDPEGYADPRWSRGLATTPTNPWEARWPIPNHPRECVCWSEAMAFCAWASERLGRAIRLPTEEQWERAARGKDGRAYPWGEEYRPGFANIDDTWRGDKPARLGRTTAVGLYPRGTSPEGVHDLAGNVWEWCLNKSNEPQDTSVAGDAPRVVRGCSWLNGQNFTRGGAAAATIRTAASATAGFGCCVRPPSSGTDH